jgi:hypothetical protein
MKDDSKLQIFLALMVFCAAFMRDEVILDLFSFALKEDNEGKWINGAYG